MSVDDYIDGLKVKVMPGTKRKRRHLTVKNIPTRSMYPEPKESRHGLTRGPRWPIIVVVFLVGTCVGGTFASAGSPSEDYLNLPVVVDPTQVVPPPQVPAQLSASCTQAIAKAQAVLDSAAAIVSSIDRTLDNLDKAYQAMMLEDGQKMNEAGAAIREQQATLMTAEVAVLTQYQVIKDGLATCPR